MGWGDAVKMTVMLTDESQVALYRAARDAAMGDVKCTLRPPPPAGCPQRRQPLSCLAPSCWLHPTVGVCAGASTLIIVKALASPAIDVEIELIAAKSG